MKKSHGIAVVFVFIAALGLFAGLSAVAQQPGRQQDREQGAQQQEQGEREQRRADYEYAVLPILESRRGRPEHYAPVLEDMLNDMGEEGWQLVGDDEEIFILMRPYQE